MKSKEVKKQVWGGRTNATPDEINVRFCAGRDVTALPMADVELVGFDIWTNLAHAAMLCKVGVLDANEFGEVKKGLLDLTRKVEKGGFKLDPEKEDVHINIEHFLTKELGIQAGNKIHTGRSRNDQVATDMRLFMRRRCLDLSSNLAELVEAVLEVASKQTDTVMPGFTHYQPAMITTAAHWMLGWSQGLLRDMQRLLDDLRSLNRSPLGAAASFGTSWPIDREFSAELLGFEGVDPNSLDCISSRGENESRIASTLCVMMNRLSTVGQDIILLASPYYGMLEVEDRFVTGSSIMPQKRNLDFAELIRAKAAQSQGILGGLLGIQKGAMSGYNRDTQQTKYLIMDLFRETLDAPLLLARILPSVTFKKKHMAALCKKGFMNSVDIADWLGQRHGLSFREAYDVLAKSVRLCDDAGELRFEAVEKVARESGFKLELDPEEFKTLKNPQKLIRRRNHTGSPAPKSSRKTIQGQKAELKKLKAKTAGLEERIDQAYNRCFDWKP